MKTLVRMLLLFLITVVVLVLAAAGVAYSFNRPPAEEAVSDHVFTVEKGESVSSIATRLEESGLIRSKLFMRALSKIKRTETAFQAGHYLVNAGSTTLMVHNLLVSGREILTKVTIPEGLTLSRLAGILEEEKIVGREEFLSACSDQGLLEKYGIRGENAEGFLFPDTYFFPADYPAQKVVETMLRRFFEVLEEIEPGYGRMHPDELKERVILASIIEREYVIPEEAPIMASVFYNRLERGMRLQSCATVAYVLTEEYGRKYPEWLTTEDLEVSSPYNTYRHGGLPPGPISNPGRVAISATFDPARTDYLYFLLKDPETGAHEFTNTFAEHINAKNLFLKKK